MYFNRGDYVNKSKKGQVTLFIIIAIVIVGAVVGYFILRDSSVGGLSQDMQPAYDYYVSCLERHASQGVALLGEQGGYIELPEFESGSSYRPYSSQLDFLGQPVAYWMYMSGNNILKEQLPTKSGMEEQLEQYVENRLSDCDFSDFNEEGYGVFIEQGSVDVSIRDNQVEVDVSNPVYLSFDSQSASVNQHRIEIDSKLGSYYDLAKDIYKYEKENMFLENYALDVLFLHAPVNDVLQTCEPFVLNEQEVKNNISLALSGNIGALKLKGSYYDLAKEENKYFVNDIGQNVDENINFIYSPDWPARMEIYGDRVVRPVGLQQGLGILGFCYVPLHYVYDVDFPVLIQIWNNDEVFQFASSVVIDKTQAREAIPSEAGTFVESPICQYKNQDVEVYTYDYDLNPVEASLKFKCLDSECYIGETESGIYTGGFPQCVNGFIIAQSEGFAEAKYMISTNEEDVANVLMKRLYNMSIEVLGDGQEVSNAIVIFRGENSQTVAYPEMKSVELAEGDYNVSVYVYKDSNLVLPATSKTECVDVPVSGVGGVFGLEEEKCFNLDMPSQELSQVVIGGGNSQEFISEFDLRDSDKIVVRAQMFSMPGSIDEVQDNYIKIEDAVTDIYLE